MHKDRATGCKGSLGEAPGHASPPVENPMFGAFEEYEEVPETVPLDFAEDEVTWVASNLSGAAGTLGEEAIELINWLLHFGCASEELMVVVARLADWMANSSPLWATYCALMPCRLMDLDKSPGVGHVGTGETLPRALAKLVMREAGYQANTACGNLQLCAGLEDGIEGAKYAVGQRRLERSRQRWVEEEGRRPSEEEDKDEAEGAERLRVETVGTEEEVAEGLEAALEMEVEEQGEGEEGGDGTIRALVYLEFLTQEVEPIRTTLVDARNGFNKMILLAMLWTVRHHWPVGARFAFNFYRHWAQLLLLHPGEPLVTILRREGVTQVDLLLMVLYGITLFPLAEAWKCCGLCGTAGQWKRGSRSISIGIGRNFYSSIQGSR